MSTTHYYRLALLQYIKMNHNLQDLHKQLEEIDSLKRKIAIRHKKHRRMDKEIQKNFNCGHCQRVYASQVALRLHLKLKHKETLLDKNSDSHTLQIIESDKQNIQINESMV